MKFHEPRSPRERRAPPAPREDARARLLADVRALACEVGERHPRRPHALAAAAAHVERELTHAGLAVERQPYPAGDGTADNLVAEIRGRALPEELILIGAHYDSAAGSAGANANASGVAVLLELARRLAHRPLARSVRFAAFATSAGGVLSPAGDKVHARQCKQRGDAILAMLSLESVGQFPLAAPAAGRAADLMASAPVEGGATLHLLVRPQDRQAAVLVGNVASRAELQLAAGSFMRATPLPIRAQVRPGVMARAGTAEHFWRQGYCALQLTGPGGVGGVWDTAEGLDYGAMAGLATGVERIVEEMAGVLLFDG